MTPSTIAAPTTPDPALSMDGLAVPSRGLKLMSGSANRPLAEAVAESMGIELTRLNLGRFADGEISVRIDENVRGNDVFIVQPTNPPGREHPRAAAADRRGAARLGGAHHLRDAVLRLRAAGPKGPAARADRRQADGEHDRRRRRRPRPRHRLPPASAPGVLRHSGRPPVRDAGVRESLQEEGAHRSGHRRPGRRVGQDGPRVREAAQRLPGDHRQASARRPTSPRW